MAEYKCKCNDDIVTKSGVTIRYVAGKGAIHDIQCEDCGEYLDIANPKEGCASFSSDTMGRVR